MKRKTIISLVLFLLTLSLSVVILVKNKNFLTNDKQGSAEVVLFYGTTCPHCKIVEEYIDKNNIESKLDIEYKEIYSNSINAQELKNRASFCGLDVQYIGVPFLWDGSNCYMGDGDIIEFLKQYN
jgi:glutaredoxin